MKREYWDKHADSFEDEIFSVFDNDTAGLIVSKLDKYGSRRQVASDIGCGIGGFLPDMSRCFKSVLAVDISSKCLKRAEKLYPVLRNVSYRHADLTDPKLKLSKVDLALSVNSVLMPSIRDRREMTKNICRHIKPGGHLVITVPSVESAMLTSAMLVEWNLRIGISPGSATAARFSAPPSSRQLRDGVFIIDGVPTKHFLKEELTHVLASSDMTVLESEKIDYPWTSEFERPPKWMKDPYPWDWLIVAKKC